MPKIADQKKPLAQLPAISPVALFINQALSIF